MGYHGIKLVNKTFPKAEMPSREAENRGLYRTKFRVRHYQETVPDSARLWYNYTREGAYCLECL